ncbi:MAG: phosphoribosyltransferase family protein [Candidatus Thorarchaeota archaeon]
MSDFKVVLASGAEHLKEQFTELGIQVFCTDPNFDGKHFFPNMDLYVKIGQVEELANQRVVVVQSCTGSTPAAEEFYTTADRVEELILLLDLLQYPFRVTKTGHKQYEVENLPPPSRVEVVLTFQPYALQDKAFSTGEAVSSRTAMNTIAGLCDRLWVVEPVVNRGLNWALKLAEQGKYEVISFTQELIEMAADTFGFKDYILTAPDEGAQTRFGVPGFSKRRSDSFTIDMQGELDVTGKNVIILDDLTKSGTTLLKAAKLLREQGATDVGLAVLHLMPIKDGGERIFDDLIAKSEGKVVTSNTVYTVAFCEKHPQLVYNIVGKIVESLR